MRRAGPPQGHPTVPEKFVTDDGNLSSIVTGFFSIRAWFGVAVVVINARAAQTCNLCNISMVAFRYIAYDSECLQALAESP